jgi:hypothetical protein
MQGPIRRGGLFEGCWSTFLRNNDGRLVMSSCVVRNRALGSDDGAADISF